MPTLVDKISADLYGYVNLGGPSGLESFYVEIPEEVGSEIVYVTRELHWNGSIKKLSEVVEAIAFMYKDLKEGEYAPLQPDDGIMVTKSGGKTKVVVSYYVTGCRKPNKEERAEIEQNTSDDTQRAKEYLSWVQENRPEELKKFVKNLGLR